MTSRALVRLLFLILMLAPLVFMVFYGTRVIDIKESCHVAQPSQGTSVAEGDCYFDGKDQFVSSGTIGIIGIGLLIYYAILFGHWMDFRAKD